MKYPSKMINILGFDVKIVSFGKSSYLYPECNGNVEYKCNKKGFKQLYSYLRTRLWVNKMLKIHYDRAQIFA